MTNQQGAPEALRTIAEWPITDPGNMDAVNMAAVARAALVEAQQPATHVQKPAEIEHVAGDVSKNGPGSNMAQQPAPSTAAGARFDEHGFRAWVLRNMPDDTIIGSSAWWADHLTKWARIFVNAAPQPSPTPQADSAPVAHGDDVAVNALAELMKAKLAKQRAKGYGGWDSTECTQQHLSNLLRAHVDKGDPVDVANFCAFLSARGEGIAPQADSQPAAVRDVEREAFKAAHRHLELDEVPDAWGRPMFKHSHVEASWLGWIARAARAPADSVTAPAATPAAASIAWNALRDATDPLGETGTRIMGLVRVFAQRQYEAGLAEGRVTPPTQAQAGAVPLTNARLQDISLDYSDSEDECTGFRDGWRAAEKHFGIKGGQHG